MPNTTLQDKLNLKTKMLILFELLIHGKLQFLSLKISVNYQYIFLTIRSALVLADIHSSIMQHCCWYEPEPIYLHWKIYSSFIPSTGAYEDNTSFSNGVLLFWEGGSEYASDFGDDNSCSWNDLLWKCVIKAWWQGAPQSLSSYQ